MKNILILIFVSLLIPIYSYSSAICVNKPDEFVIKCTIDEKYFTQNFTCLNYECSSKIINNGTISELKILNSPKVILLKNQILLQDIYKDLRLLNILCIEKFSQNELLKLEEISKEYFSNPIKSYSKDKHTIEPNFKNRLDELNNIKNNKDSTFDECYTIKIEVFETWIVKKNIRKDYCTIEYNEKDDCFQTNLNKEKYAAFLITNPQKTYNMLFIYFLISTLIITSSIFLYKLKKEKKFMKFIKPSKHKIMLQLILMIPAFYIIGIITNYIINKKYYFFMTLWLEILIVIISVIIIYFLSALIEYHIKCHFIKKK